MSPPANFDAEGGEPAGSPTDFGICQRCHGPLRPGAEGGCLRCMIGLAASVEDDAFHSAAGIDLAEVRRYSHFEIVLGLDGSLDELGSGAMGTTYRARDTVLESHVALKVIRKNVADSPAVRARFLREARAAARLRHPNVASVFHYGEQEGECFYAMELVEGETLERCVHRDGPLSVEMTLEVGIQVARALSAAEAQGLVHRDLKPSNLMLVSAPPESRTPGELPLIKVIDFGLAKAVAVAGSPGEADTIHGFVGTPVYASPEQFARGEQTVDTRSDIYSLGVTLWYLLCGRTPFTGHSLEEIHAQQVSQRLAVDQLSARRVPAPLVDLLRAMLAVKPGARPASARELIQVFRHCQEQCSTRNSPVTGRSRRLAWGSALGVLAIMVAGAWVRLPHKAPLIIPTDKSIAVLPFEDLSPEKNDAFFTRGVRCEISENLGRIADLKVTDLTSTDFYPPGKRDLARIGRELGVWHLLEGSLRREDGQVHVQIRFVDVRDPAQNWTAHYDRLITDVFAVQGEITHAVAARLNAKISPREEAVIDDPPTRDLAAYDLYLRADEGTNRVTSRPETIQFTRETEVPLLVAAVARDPGFALAYCRLATAYDYLQGDDAATTANERVVDYRSLADAALASARRLRPDAGELHLAQAIHFLDVVGDPEQARIEAELGYNTLPNNADIILTIGNIAVDQNHWEKCIDYTERSLALDPRNNARLFTLAYVDMEMRRYEEAEHLLARAIAEADPGKAAGLRTFAAVTALEARADPAPLRVAIQAFTPEETRQNRANLELGRLIFVLCERDADTASSVLQQSAESSFLWKGLAYPKAWFAALIARMRQDRTGAQAAFLAARPDAERSVQSEPQNGLAWGLLAMIDAGLGNKDDAVREALHACELTPLEHSAPRAPLAAANLAVVYAWTNQPDLACSILEQWSSRPSDRSFLCELTYGGLRLSPVWDPLRGNPRFEAVIQRLAPTPPR